MFVGMPTNISSVDTSFGWAEKGQKLLVTGKVYKFDGKTPASNVIIYYWQTDNNGYYSPTKEMDDKAKRQRIVNNCISIKIFLYFHIIL